MNLIRDLEELQGQGAIIQTVQTRKLTIDGHTHLYPVFKVRLDLLFYNDQNDRIATWISHYKSEHNGNVPDRSDREAYNRIIEEFIVSSNPESIRKTQANIEMVDQREAGVVLADGRIIDGNRRFTCLRRLAEKNDRFKYFETVILERKIETNAKQIKMLELSIQHGEESKVDYNPVDRLVGVYNDIVLTSLLSVEEYAKSSNESESDVKKSIEISKLMVEFLQFINAPEQFYIARDLELCFPLEELLKLFRKCKTKDEIEDLKSIAFANILMQTSSDMGRYIRNMKLVLGTDYQEEFFEEQMALAAKVIDELPAPGKVNLATIREKVRANEERRQELKRSMDKALVKTRRDETKNKPILLAEKAVACLESMDLNILQKMNSSERLRLVEQLDKLGYVANQIKEKL